MRRRAARRCQVSPHFEKEKTSGGTKKEEKETDPESDRSASFSLLILAVPKTDHLMMDL